MGLLPPRALDSVADVLTFGAKKYLPNNWKYVENGRERYLDAALRHITAYMKGEQFDQETDLPHLSHALCCLMFIVDLDIEENETYNDEEDTQSVNQQAMADLLKEMFSHTPHWREEEKSPREYEKDPTLGDVLNQIIRNGRKNENQ